MDRRFVGLALVVLGLAACPSSEGDDEVGDELGTSDSGTDSEGESDGSTTDTDTTEDTTDTGEDPCPGERHPFRFSAHDVITNAPLTGASVELCGMQQVIDENGDAYFPEGIPLESMVVARVSGLADYPVHNFVFTTPDAAFLDELGGTLWLPETLVSWTAGSTIYSAFGYTVDPSKGTVSIAIGPPYGARPETWSNGSRGELAGLDYEAVITQDPDGYIEGDVLQAETGVVFFGNVEPGLGQVNAYDAQGLPCDFVAGLDPAMAGWTIEVLPDELTVVGLQCATN
jgi:hypothetical protein